MTTDLALLATEALADCAANWGDERLPQRFWDKVIPEPMSGCWLWAGTTNPKGYGRFFVGAENSKHIMKMTHRISYETLVGGFSPDLVIDHLCLNQSCCNPQHLEPVTGHENSLRYTRGIIKCPAGHPYDAENTCLRSRGSRECRTCMRARLSRARKAAKDRMAA